MASVGHALVGFAVARAHRNATSDAPQFGLLAGGLAFAALALLPDVDVVGFRLGVAYDAPWGHRGATHSLAMALVVALAVTPVLSRVLRASFAVTFAAALTAIASHGLLDTLTDGGLGVALAWPLSDARFFAPLRPIPVAPIGLAFLSTRGLDVALTELLLFAPCALFAVLGARRDPRSSDDAPRRRRVPLFMFRACAALSAAAALFHLVAALVPMDDSSPARHAVFVVVNVACVAGFLLRPRWFPWVFSLLVVQQLRSHGGDFLLTHHVVDGAVALAMPLVLALLLIDHANRNDDDA